MYQTPDTEDVIEDTCYVLRFPGSAAFKGLVNGALASLIFENGWEEDGTLTPQETAQIFKQMLANAEHRCMIGSIMPFAGADIPAWALLCDGSEYDATLYPKLFAVLDDAFKSEDSFVVPDMIDKTAVGAKAASIGSFDFAEVGGEIEHIVSVAEMPFHSHTNSPHTHTDAGHAHGIQYWITTPVLEPGEVPAMTPVPIVPSFTDVGYANISSNSVDIDSTGESEPHNNMQPFIALKWIIVAK